MTQSTFEIVRDNIAATPFHQWLLPELKEVNEEKGSVTIYLPLRKEFQRLPGRSDAHGGIIAALIDITGHAAICSKVHHSVATIDMRVDYLRLAGGTALHAVATIVKMGRTIAVVDIQIFDDQDKLAAIGRAAYLTASV
jgi:uncharacterized protein (TIGR00369 family)